MTPIQYLPYNYGDVALDFVVQLACHLIHLQRVGDSIPLIHDRVGVNSPEQTMHLGGTVTGISLTSFLQLLSWEKKSSAVHVSSEGKEGTLYVEAGKLIDAEAASDTGLKAFFSIHGWPAPIIQLSPLVSRPPRIDLSLTQLLLEASKRQDESLSAVPGNKELPHTEEQELPLPDDDRTRIITLLIQIPEILHCSLMDRNGRVIAQSSHRPKFQSPFRYALLAGSQIQNILGGSEAQYIQLNDASNEILLLVPEHDRVLGFHLRKAVPIRDLIDRIRHIFVHEGEENNG